MDLPGRVDLGALVDLAVRNSPLLQKAEAEREEGAWKQVEGSATLLPVLTLNAGHIFERRFQYLNIPFGGGPVIEFPQIFPTTGGTLYEWSRFQLEQEVSLAYYRYLAAKQLEEVARSNLSTLENHLAQAELLQAGDNSVIAHDRVVAAVGGASPEIAEGPLLSPEKSLVERVQAPRWDGTSVRRGGCRWFCCA